MSEYVTDAAREELVNDALAGLVVDATQGQGLKVRPLGPSTFRIIRVSGLAEKSERIFNRPAEEGGGEVFPGESFTVMQEFVWLHWAAIERVIALTIKEPDAKVRAAKVEEEILLTMSDIPPQEIVTTFKRLHSDWEAATLATASEREDLRAETDANAGSLGN